MATREEEQRRRREEAERRAREDRMRQAGVTPPSERRATTPSKPKAPPKPGYDWVWNGSAWVETKLGKDNPPTQKLPDGYEWSWSEETQTWGFRQTSPDPGPDPGPDPDPPDDTTGTRPPSPGQAWQWSEAEGKWVRPPRDGVANDGFYKWDDDLGWVQDTGKMSAYEVLSAWFKEYGIDDESSGQNSLSSLIWGWIKDDKSSDWIKLELRKTDQYRARFPGMEAISRKGMAMSEAEYVATERAYLQVLSAAGLDSVYGNRADYGRFIASEVSAQELAGRVQIAKDYVNMYAPQSVKQQLRDLYGMDDAQMAAYVLDTSEGKKKSLAALESEYAKRQSQAQVGGAAVDTGLGISTPLRDQIAEAGYNYNQAMTGLGRAKTEADPYRRLGNLYGVATSTDELIQENFGLGGGAEATTKKRKLASKERAAFSGSSALSAGSLAANRIGQV